MIANALEVAAAKIVAIWLPILVSVLIIYFLAKFFHRSIGELLTHLKNEADSFSKKKRNTLSINFIGGIAIMAVIVFYIVDVTTLHVFESLTQPGADGGAVNVLSYVILLALFFIICPVAVRYFDPNA